MKIVSILALAIVCTSAVAATPKPQKPATQAVKTDVPIIEIKGLRLGLERPAVEAIVGDLYNYRDKNFTIAEVVPYHGHLPSTDYIDEKLSMFFFSFAADDFESIQSAITKKYPMTRCAKSAVQNRMGATFPQVTCELTSSDGNLTIAKYGSELTSGYLMLVSNAQLAKRMQSSEKRDSDI